MAQKNKLLLLSYYWPPGSGPGVQRWLKFCKFLPQEGWLPSVITVKNGSYPSLDPSLEKEIPPSVEVLKTKTWEPFTFYNLLRGNKGKTVEVGMGSIKGKKSVFSSLSNYIRANFFIPDARVGWNRFALKAACDLINKEWPKIIVTTGPPHSTHLVGLKLKQEFGIPWVADFRDPWTTVYYNRYLNRGSASKAKDERLENLVLGNADAVIVVSNILATEFKGRANKVIVLPNGYDTEDVSMAYEKGTSKKFTLSYIGNLKANQNVKALWEALAEMARTVPGFRDEFELNCTGNIHPSVMESWNEAGIVDLVSTSPFVPHAESVKKMSGSYMLLLPVPDEPQNKGTLTGKIFEYLACRRPILSIGPVDGDASKLIQECGKDPMVDYMDKEAMIGQLSRYFETYKASRELLETGNANFTRYSRENLTKELSIHLHKITQR